MPERLIGADPKYYTLSQLEGIGSAEDAGWLASSGTFDPAAKAEYLRVNRSPEAIHAMCEDYRASTTIDLEHDAKDEDKKLSCPVLLLWGRRNVIEPMFEPLQVWQSKAESLEGHGLDCAHYLAEEVPDGTYAHLRRFFLDRA